MKLTDLPGKIVLPFADGGGKNVIPTDSQIGITAGAASLEDGFPPLTRTPLAGGGTPPSGLDMNGILFAHSALVRWVSAGAGFPWDTTFANDVEVDGYPIGSRVLRTDGKGYWLNLTDNNTTDPESAGSAAAGWVPDFTNGTAAVTMTSSNVTLTPLQYGKPVVVITGALTTNLNLIFPDIAGQWVVLNNTTGAFTITCKTLAGTGVIVDSVLSIVGDEVNIYRDNEDLYSLIGSNYVKLTDTKATTVNGGGSSTGVQTRDLTTEDVDSSNICTLAANQFTLAAGTYRVDATAPAFKSSRHRAFLYNVSDASTEIVGSSEYSISAEAVQTQSKIVGEFTIATPKTFEIRHYFEVAGAADGLGKATLDGLGEIYTMVELWRTKIG